MDIKQIMKTALSKTKNVMKKILDFFNKKRFSLITLFISLILCLDLYSCIARPKPREPTIANAESTISSYEYAYVLPLYFEYVGARMQSDIALVLSNNGNYVQYRQYSSSKYDKQIAFFDNNIVSLTNNVGYVSSSFLSFNVDLQFNILEYDYINQITHLRVISNGFELLRVIPNNTLVVAQIISSQTVSTSVHIDYPVFYFDLTSNDLDYDTVFDEGYIAGYGEGYEEGKNEWYEVGFIDGKVVGKNEGLNTSFQDISPFEVIKSGVDSFLSTDIIGNINLGDILKISFGLILLGYVIKVFLGG